MLRLGLFGCCCFMFVSVCVVCFACVLDFVCLICCVFCLLLLCFVCCDVLLSCYGLLG